MGLVIFSIVSGLTALFGLAFIVGKILGKNPFPDKVRAIFTYTDSRSWERAKAVMPYPPLKVDDTAHVSRAIYPGIILDLLSPEAALQLEGCNRGLVKVTKHPREAASAFVKKRPNAKVIHNPDSELAVGLMSLVIFPGTNDFYVFGQDVFAMMKDSNRRKRLRR